VTISSSLPLPAALLSVSLQRYIITLTFGFYLFPSPFHPLSSKEESKIMGRVYFILMLVGVMAIGGCGQSKTYNGPNGEKVTVNKDGSSLEIDAVGKDGSKIKVSTSGNGVALPGDFPKDAPVYPGAIALSSVNSNDGTMITLQTADSAEKVDEFYAKELKSQGWTTESTVKLPQGTTYINKKEKRTLNISINGGDKTMIVLIVGQEK
jgi:hypothetical protein